MSNYSDLYKIVRASRFPKWKKELAIVGLDLCCFTEEDIQYLAHEDITPVQAENYLHAKVMRL